MSTQYGSYLEQIHMDATRSRPSRELRLALGMRGGVSLAIWIGGACAEIDDLRRGHADWAPIVDLAGYEGVVVDVMAGASAGGLNAIMFATSQVYGFRMADYRPRWMQLADFSKLLRDDIDKYAPSLLDGDCKFFAELFEYLKIHVHGDRPESGAPRIDATLTATLVEPIEREVEGGTERRFASSFRFRHRSRFDWETDFPDPDDASALDAALARLALAGRATSSYPVAFEGALIHAPRPAAFGVPAAGAHLPSMLDVPMTGVFADATSSDRPFVISDGGVLDNIPLGRAIDAVADAPADRPTDRVLIYLNPGGDASPTGDEVLTDANRRMSRQVIEGTIKTRIQSEDIVGDLAQLTEHNRLIERSTWMREVSLFGLTSRDGLRHRAEAGADLYRLRRADVDAQDVRRLLDDPLSTLGEDPFPSTTLDERLWRAPLGDWSSQTRDSLDADLADAFDTALARRDTAPANGEVASLGVGVGPISRLAAILREWLMAVEPDVDGKRRMAIGEAKEGLYRILQAHAALVERPTRLAWVVRAAAPAPATGTGTGRWAAQSMDEVDALCRMGNNDLTAVREFVDTGRSNAMDEVTATQLGRLVQPSTHAAADGGDLRALLVDLLVAVADEVNTMTLPPQLATPGAGQQLHDVLYQHDPAGNPEPVEVADLEALEIVLFDQAQLSALGLRPIKMVKLSAANPTPISRLFGRLLRAQADDPARGGDPEDFGTDAPQIAVKNKLAGNELNNFAAFLERSWRANDWMWGRLDAVPTLVDLLVDGPALVDAAERLRRRDLRFDQVQAALVESLRVMVCRHRDPRWSTYLTGHLWGPRLPLVTEEVHQAVEVAFEVRDDPPEVANVRSAIVVHRQLSILAAELAAHHDDGDDNGGPPAPASPEETVALAGEYGVGLETLTEPAPGAARRKLTRDTIDRAQAVLAANLPPLASGVASAVVAPLGALWLRRRALTLVVLCLALGGALLTVVGVPFVLDDNTATSWSWATAAATLVLGLAIPVGVAMGKGAVAMLAAAAAMVLAVVTGAVGQNWLALTTWAGVLVFLVAATGLVVWSKRPKVLA